MKRFGSSMLILFGLAFTGLMLADLALAPPASADVSFGFSYSNLAPHGNWYVSASYGRVWQPAIYRPGWSPYYDGRWVYTDVGWCWQSDYAWGAVPYHYGTWAQDPYYGWVWVPGTTWAPAWVVWRTGPGYVGWAPVAPAFSIGVSFHAGDWDDSNFVFVGAGNVFCPHVGTYAVPAVRNRVIINSTRIVNDNFTVVNNVVVNQGPGLGNVERAMHRRIRAVPLESVKAAGGPSARGFTRDQIRIDPAVNGRALKATGSGPAAAHLGFSARSTREPGRTPSSGGYLQARTSDAVHAPHSRKARASNAVLTTGSRRQPAGMGISSHARSSAEEPGRAPESVGGGPVAGTHGHR